MRVPVRLVTALAAFVALVAPSAASAWTWPVEGPVLQPFSFGSDPYAAGQHRGIDIGAPTGTPVLAPAGGTVTFAGIVPNGGKTVTIQTPSGYAVTLVHLGSIGILPGTAVEEGKTVGTVGPSGAAEHSEPYVHLGIRIASDEQGYVDPLLFLPPRPTLPVPPAAADAPTPPAAEAPVGETPAVPVAEAPAAEAPADGASAPTPPDATAPAADEAAAIDSGAAPAGDEGVSADTSAPAAHDDAQGAEQPASPASAAPSAGDGAQAESPETAAPPPAAEPQPSAVASGPEEASPAQPVGEERAVGQSEPEASPNRPARAAEADEARALRSRRPDDAATETLSSRLAEVAGSPAQRSRPSWIRSKTTRSGRERPDAARLQPAPTASRRPEPVEATTTSTARPTSRPADRTTSSQLPSILGATSAAAVAAGAAAVLLLRRRRPRPGAAPSGAEAARIMVLRGGAEAGTDPRGAGVAVRGGPASPWPHDRVCGPGRHLRPLPPASGERRPDGERDGRARHARDGRGGQRGRLAA